MCFCSPPSWCTKLPFPHGGLNSHCIFGIQSLSEPQWKHCLQLSALYASASSKACKAGVALLAKTSKRRAGCTWVSGGRRRFASVPDAGSCGAVPTPAIRRVQRRRAARARDVMSPPSRRTTHGSGMLQYDACIHRPKFIGAGPTAGTMIIFRRTPGFSAPGARLCSRRADRRRAVTVNRRTTSVARPWDLLPAPVPCGGKNEARSC